MFGKKIQNESVELKIDSQTNRRSSFRYMVLDEANHTLRIYNNERSETLLYDIEPRSIFNCCQPNNPDERSQHIFVVSWWKQEAGISDGLVLHSSQTAGHCQYDTQMRGTVGRRLANVAVCANARLLAWLDRAKPEEGGGGAVFY